MRTLRIMEGVFRRGMLEEVLLEPGVVHAIFPCLDQLVALHSRFVSQLLSRRNHSLAPGSTTNFTIQQLGDVLVEQVGTDYYINPLVTVCSHPVEDKAAHTYNSQPRCPVFRPERRRDAQVLRRILQSAPESRQALQGAAGAGQEVPELHPGE